MVFPQLQQAATAEGRTGTETLAPLADRREWEDGQVAVYAAVRGAGLGDQEIASWGNVTSYLDFSFRVTSPFLFLAARTKDL